MTIRHPIRRKWQSPTKVGATHKERNKGNMTQEQEQALATLIEWRDAIHERVLTGGDRENGDIGLWFALIGIRNAMNEVTTSFGLGSFTDSSEEVSA